VPYDFMLGSEIICNLTKIDSETSQSTTQSNENLEENVKKCTNCSLTYADCSNMSISSFLNKNVQINVNIANFTTKQQNASCQYAGKQFLKNRNKTGKTKFLCKISTLFRDNLQSIIIWCTFFCKKMIDMWTYLVNFPKTSWIAIHKRSSAQNNNNNLFIQHKCQNDAYNLRSETAYLTFEFKSRLKLIAMKTFESIYFTFVIGRICVPVSVNIRESEYIVYFITATSNTLISYWLYYIPLSFLSKIYFEKNKRFFKIPKNLKFGFFKIFICL